MANPTPSGPIFPIWFPGTPPSPESRSLQPDLPVMLGAPRQKPFLDTLQMLTEKAETSWDFSSQQLWQLSEVQELYYYITYIHVYSRFHHISPTWGQLLDKFNHTMASYGDWDWIWLRKCGFMARLIEDYQWIELGASISGGIQKLPMVYHGKSH